MNHDMKNTKLTSVEIGILWNTYMIESMVHHMSSCFLKHIDDSNVRDMVKSWVEMTRESISALQSFFRQESLPTPVGITSEDINTNAPRLFSDKYIIYFGELMSRFALNSFTMAYTQCSRLDMREFIKKNYVERLIRVNQQTVEISLAKGVHARPPYAPTPKEVDFVQRQSFFDGLLGKKRPLTVLEITHLFTNAHSNALGSATLTAYSQVVKSKAIQEHFLEGKGLSAKLYKNFIDILLKEDISIPPSLTGEIYDSVDSPFSDKLMLFHDTMLASAGLGAYGMAVAMSPRSDLAALYAKAAVESGAYAKDGDELMVKYAWMEQTPTAPQRIALLKASK